MKPTRKRPVPRSHALRAFNAICAAQLPATTKVALFVICKRLNTARADWCVWGGVRRMAREAGLSRSSAHRAVQRIVEMGIAAVAERHALQRDGWRGRPSTCLRIDIERLEALGQNKAAPLVSQGYGTNYVPGVGQNSAPGVPLGGTEVEKSFGRDAEEWKASPEPARRAGARAAGLSEETPPPTRAGESPDEVEEIETLDDPEPIGELDGQILALGEMHRSGRLDEAALEAAYGALAREACPACSIPPPQTPQARVAGRSRARIATQEVTA